MVFRVWKNLSMLLVYEQRDHSEELVERERNTAKS